MCLSAVTIHQGPITSTSERDIIFSLTVIRLLIKPGGSCSQGAGVIIIIQDRRRLQASRKKRDGWVGWAGGGQTGRQREAGRGGVRIK